jgi:kumamolisin
VSTYYRRPSWQVGVGVDNKRSNGMRQVPDVAAAADPDSGFLTVSAGQSGAGGGTSAAAPFWAGFAALVRQLGEQEGVKGLGSLGKTLYEVAAAQPAGSVFHDVTRGGNLYDDAGPGWDYATGLGTPRGTPLAHAIVDHLKGGG